MKFLITPILLAIFLLSCEKENIETNQNVKACFSYRILNDSTGEVQFSNCSENAKSYLWNFGDSTTSQEKEPKHTFGISFVRNVTLIAYNGVKSDTIIKNVSDQIVVYKPNIYLYPVHSLSLCVNISFPLGGQIIESIPNYKNGWCVNVKPNGSIDNKYRFLFYESRQPNLFQYRKGWCVEQQNLNNFFKENLALYNFSDEEINDFLEYWIPKLTKYNYYIVYPQTNNDINKIIKLYFSEIPDNVNRLFYGFEGKSQFTQMEAPTIEIFKREGFYVMEWGGFEK